VPAPLYDFDAIALSFKKGAILAQENFIDVAQSDISPARLFMKGPKELFVSHKTAAVRYQTELIRPVPEDIDHEPAEILNLYLMLLLQTANPRPRLEKWNDGIKTKNRNIVLMDSNPNIPIFHYSKRV
jgi:hypothetical protein